MEIPSAYNYVTNEQEKSIDFLDKKRNLSFYFDEEAAASLPEVSQEDIETGQEKYCLLLGNTQPNEKDENTSVEIKCVLQSEDNEIKFYEEGREYVDINLTTAQKVVKALQDGYPEYKNCELVGEVHTHPV
ncbi:hypothetical protein M0Q03_01870, partial [bacterium]|nr:hypothetical protein [bacterium]